MKQKDIAFILMIVVISGIVSVVVSRMFISSPKNRDQKVEVVVPINADPNSYKVDTKYFNDKSVNPTKSIVIGDNDNDKPFNSAQ